ncbi:MAG: hypothetical protein AAFQ74_20520 [Cyanobacteria bacterium J06623_4]
MQPSNHHYLQREPTVVSSTHYCVVGDVTVDDTAAIAAGVVLQASPGSRIVIAPGACLAAGVCVQSRKGVLTIGAGASLGANVLVIGSGNIGQNACISAASTLLNPQVADAEVVLPGTVVGDSHGGSDANGAARYGSAQTLDSNGFGASEDFKNTFVAPPPLGPRAIETPDLSDQNGQYVDPAAAQNGSYAHGSYQSNGYQNNGVQLNGNQLDSPNNSQSAITVRSNDRVYGRDQVSQLLSTLFPHRQSTDDRS